jgi:hypothetical protein
VNNRLITFYVCLTFIDYNDKTAVYIKGRFVLPHFLCWSCFISDTLLYKHQVNVRDNRRGNQEWVNPEKLATMSTQDTGRRHTKKN